MSGRDPADRRAGDRRQGPQPRHRLHLRRTRISVGLGQAGRDERRSVDVVTAAGANNPECRRSRATRRSARRLPDLGQVIPADGVQGPDRAADQVRDRQGRRRFNYQSVGPTFGKTVANSAVIAIIASLLVISVYIALRFEWKFAVPVLIALMHDLLITAGVYSLTGREVTTATVAALLTILGYSLYDTIIVFDRVRENVPRMPRAAFSQIVNRSMSEVLTRSLATTSCTLMPILALLLFGGATLQGLRLRAADRRRLRRVLVDLHRLAGADALEGARAAVPRPAPPDRGGARAASRPTRAPAPTSSRSAKRCAPARPPDHARARDRLGGRVRADEARPRRRGGRALPPDLDADQAHGARAAAPTAPARKPRPPTRHERTRRARRPSPSTPRAGQGGPPSAETPTGRRWRPPDARRAAGAGSRHRRERGHGPGQQAQGRVQVPQPQPPTREATLAWACSPG